jgi:outer membrane protein OmpA-like peptidoglycan-associated protein
MTKNYYRVIDGIRYDRQMLEVAEQAVEGKEEKQITIETAKKLYEAIIDGNTFTEVENDTLEYLRKSYLFTPEADEWLIHELEVWMAGKDTSGYPTRLPKSKPEPVGPTIPSSDSQSTKSRPFPGKRFKKTESHDNPTSASGSPGSPLTQTTHLSPGAASFKADSDRKGKPAVIWIGLVIVLLLLIPVTFFIGRTTAPYQDDPATLAKIKELESSAQDIKRQLEQFTTENENLKNSLAQATAEGEAAKIRKQIAAIITEQLGPELANNRIQFDPEQLWLTFLSASSFFSAGSATMNPVLQTRLQRIFPGLIQSLKPYQQKITEIRFQGHSSSEWKTAKNKSEAYLNNMTLSADRAETALKYCIGLKEVQPERSWLIDKVVSSGFSDRKPILTPSKAEDLEKSRRITISIGVVAPQ